MWQPTSKKYNHVFPYEKYVSQKGKYYIFDVEKDHVILHELFYYMSSNLPIINVN